MKMEKSAEESQKMYYSIGEVAKMFHVNTSLIRFWETEFSCIEPYKSKKGTRYFTRKDIAVLGKIYYLVKQKGYTLQGARQILSANEEQINTNAMVAEKLTKIRNFLVEMKEQLDS
jgi:DNA-binding transcriptional MerR regulator